MTRPRVYCVVYGCMNSSSQKPELSFFKLPADIERRTKWLNLIDREDLISKPPANYTVCEEHFSTHDVLPGKKRKMLKYTALPALLLPSRQIKTEGVVAGTSFKQEEVDIPMDICPDTIPPISTQQEETGSPTAFSIKTEKIDEEETKFEIEKFHKLCDRFLTKELADLVKVQTYLTQNSEGKACVDYKEFCLNLYLISPQTYRLLKTALCLPCPNTNLIPITTDLNGKHMLILKSIVERMTEREKICSVSIDSISLHPNLTYNIKEDIIIGFDDVNGVRTLERAKLSFVVMVRGIYDNWKLPVAYALLSEYRMYTEVYKWIDELLENLFAIGLNVRTFASTTWSDLFNPAKYKSISVEKPYFFVGNRKIYYIFDAPYLLILIRNYFMSTDFHFHNCVAKYDHIRQFYNTENKRKMKYSKITSSHVCPNNFDKTKVIYAAQLLSNSVAVGMSTYVDFNLVVKSAQHTVEFIKLMNDLFDSLNSSNLKDTGRKSAFRGEESQVELFKEICIYLKNLSLINPKTGLDVTSNVKFIEGFQITINSILQLYNDLKSEGHTYLLTRRLNLDLLRDFNDQVKKKCGMTSEPTSYQLVLAFRKCFFSNVITFSKRGNGFEDMGEILNEVQFGLGNKVCAKEQDVIPKIIPNNDEIDSVKISSSDYNQLDLSDKLCTFDVCVFLLQKCYEYHRDCEILKSYIKPDQRSEINFSKNGRYQDYKKYIKICNKSLIIVPSDNFVKYVTQIEKQFWECLQKDYINPGIVASIVRKIAEIEFNAPCPCFPKMYILKLFVRMRMYLTIKMNNTLYKPRKFFSVKPLKKYTN